ncbi:MAG: hypothetical protein HY082_03405 [Gammaproteobacteria bacterium]|nr:hypothetical protein [Gammaproteobacteria bacterium]
MSQTPIPEFAQTELWVVHSTLTERYGHDIEVQTDAYDEIGDAVIGVLQVEAGHVRKTKIKVDDSRDGGGRAASGTAAGEAPAKPADDARDGGGRATQGAVADAAPDKSDLSPIFRRD